MARGYFATKLSDNIGETPEGFRICRGTVLGRTGWQRYTVADLIKNFKPEKLADLQIDVSNPSAAIDLYRPAEEVFAAQTLLSAEGKPFTLNHPPEFVDPDNFRKYTRGHTQNVHKGASALESGDWPLEGDIIINDGDAIRAVDAGKRELSLGYVYDIARDGEKILQIGFMINHVALVDSARAGSEARIYDSAPAAALDEATLRQIEAAAWDQTDSAPEDKPVPIIPQKEKATVKKPNVFHRLLKALALDNEATPEEVVEGSKLLHKAMDEESEEEKKKRESEDSRRAAEDKRRADDMKAAEDKKRADDAAADKKRADDEAAAAEEKRKAEEKDSACKPGEDGHKNCTKDKCMAKDRGARDADGGDHRSRMHAALDNMLDKHEEAHGPLEGEDADMEELKDLMGKFLSEESQEPEHAGDAEESEMLEPVGEPGSEVMANDAAEALLPLIEKSPERKTLQLAFDAAPLDTGEFDFLKAIKPAIAKSKDVKVRRAFDAQVRKYSRSSKPLVNGTGYGAFGVAARAHDSSRVAEAARLTTGVPGARVRDNSKIQQIYNDARNGKFPQK